MPPKATREPTSEAPLSLQLLGIRLSCSFEMTMNQSGELRDHIRKHGLRRRAKQGHGRENLNPTGNGKEKSRARV